MAYAIKKSNKNGSSLMHKGIASIESAREILLCIKIQDRKRVKFFGNDVLVMFNEDRYEIVNF